jgi:two-component system, LuxR family, response regulator FixJ
MAASPITVFVVDGEPAARASTAALVSSMGFECQTFSSAKQFLDVADLSRPGCIVVDLHLEGMDAFQLQDRLVESGNALPILFVGVSPTVSEVVLAMRGGAFSVFEKPYIANELAEAIRKAATIARHSRFSHHRLETLRTRFEALNPREREVMTLVATGIATKIISRELGVCQRTAAQIRADVFKKMDAKSAVDLAVMANDLRRFDCEGIVMHANISGRSNIAQCVS